MILYLFGALGKMILNYVLKRCEFYRFEFLNFMAKGGYEMSTQEELKYGWNYTFKKK